MTENKLRLCTTTIGDLLCKNQISLSMDDGKAIDNVSLTIPEYQRPYKWTAKNANQLLDDILLAMNYQKEVYRVGTLILHLDEKQNYNIVDGQQRTITFSLLLRALGYEGIDFLQQKLPDDEHTVHNILKNSKIFGRRIDGLDKEKLSDYIKSKCELIVVITSDLSEAFQFFDSQNARGKALYPHDLLKAFHLREMSEISAVETEKIVRIWEDTDQRNLSSLFSDYLYRIKEWLKGNRSEVLCEKNIDIFKGVTAKDTHPYAQFYKGAFAYADGFNHSSAPFVTGAKNLKPFQLNTPIIAGKPFFEYTKHYFDILADIRCNDKYFGYFINGNEIVKTLDNYYWRRTGDKITRLMFDTAVLVYVDRFCPEVPSRSDLEMFDKFVNQAFIWAYSMRAQYQNVGWQVAQNYITENSRDNIRNSLNIYKLIADSDSPVSLLSKLSDLLLPLNLSDIKADKSKINNAAVNGVYETYLHYFDALKFLED